MIVRQAKDGTHRHFEITEDRDADGYVIALEVPDDTSASTRKRGGSNRPRSRMMRRKKADGDVRGRG
jgi:hypothetical protein